MAFDRKSYPAANFWFDGHEYRWSGWFGCQLESWEWRTVRAGTQRVLDFGVGKPQITMTVASTRREGLKVRTTWAVANHGTHDEHVARIVELKAALQDLV